MAEESPFEDVANQFGVAGEELKSIKEYVENLMKNLPPPENVHAKVRPFPNPFPNPFTEWYYDNETPMAWCDMVPEIPKGVTSLKGLAAKYSVVDEAMHIPEEKPATQGVDPYTWRMAQALTDSYILDVEAYGKFKYNLKCNPNIEHDHDPRYTYGKNKHVPKLVPKPTEKFPEKIIGIDQEQMERLLKELKEL
jgi:hypothetical protein